MLQSLIFIVAIILVFVSIAKISDGGMVAKIIGYFYIGTFSFLIAYMFEASSVPERQISNGNSLLLLLPLVLFPGFLFLWMLSRDVGEWIQRVSTTVKRTVLLLLVGTILLFLYLEVVYLRYAFSVYQGGPLTPGSWLYGSDGILMYGAGWVINRYMFGITFCCLLLWRMNKKVPAM
ncbi:hypothetical protein [Aureibacillus halotolerans]|uniref:Uncharacterized protein n=1 Tax=Aureibacillus halotolerans TaxID=1508390 RepID=A0A4R6UCN0_9BACI|nr:hypothetical protein [Aureibacillus halotolerans]TDQ40844.1 hypothetical protein EV213_105190 [Aureibacillus halotolerans]